jgi:hypothetical protein
LKPGKLRQPPSRHCSFDVGSGGASTTTTSAGQHIAKIRPSSGPGVQSLGEPEGGEPSDDVGTPRAALSVTSKITGPNWVPETMNLATLSRTASTRLVR